MAPGAPGAVGPSAWMRIALARPGFFVVDVHVVVHVNGWCAYDGGFLEGFDVRFPVHPGPCAIATRLDLGIASRNKSYTVEARAGHGVEVWLEYSRFWGNFTGSPRVAYLPVG